MTQLDPGSWETDARLAAEVSQQFDKIMSAYDAQPHLIAEHANLEDSIRTGGYADRTLLELVQNAADALTDADDATSPMGGRVEIVLNTDTSTLYCANGGRPFSIEGVTAITMAHLSHKRGDEIGRFGLGFKSVLAVSDRPQVLSRSVSFEFNSAASNARFAKLAVGKRVPVLRTPTLLDPVAEFNQDPVLAELASWATTIVKLPQAKNLEQLRDKMDGFAAEFLLFVTQVRNVRMRVVGDNPVDLTHRSIRLGGDHFRIETSEDAEDWLVASRMHRPTSEVRAQVGEAVFRSAVKVSAAIPLRRAHLRTGRFWSYFPLQDTTSASALFNAPWSVNDDRTTLLRNDYNREILRELAEVFVELLKRVPTEQDPALHLDYMPARGREVQGFGDELLTMHVPRVAAEDALVPDGLGVLRSGSELRPLDPAVNFEVEVHHAWAQSPHTGVDTPHWRCYTTQARVTRLRDLLSASAGRSLDPRVHDQRRTLHAMPKRGVLSWLREWAEGPDRQSSADALKTVVSYSRMDGIEAARVIPTTDGYHSLQDRQSIYLGEPPDVIVDDAAFVEASFAQLPGIEKLLRDQGFTALDAAAVLKARLAALSHEPSDEQLEKVWDAALDLPSRSAIEVMRQSRAAIKVPTYDGGWAWPAQVLDLPTELGAKYASRLLDSGRCSAEIAHGIGVIQRPVVDFALEDEPLIERYEKAVLEDVNTRLGPGDRPIKAVDFTPAEGPGPFSVLFLLEEAGASDQVRELWTTTLLQTGQVEWVCEDLHSARTFTVESPVLWAVHQVGLVKTIHDFRPPRLAVAPSMVRFEALLPLFRGPGVAATLLNLPDTFSDIPLDVLVGALEAQSFPMPVQDDVLVDFLVASCGRLAADRPPRTIPARVSRAVEARPPEAVFIVTTDEQQELLRARQRPYLRASLEQAEALVTTIGCRRFEDSFSFNVVIEGRGDSERLLDKFPGLRQAAGAERLRSSRIVSTTTITKQVITDLGMENQPLSHHLDGIDLVVLDKLDERALVDVVVTEFKLGLNQADISRVLQIGRDRRLELLREQANAAITDEEKLDCYIGEDDLRDALPAGLWSALEAQGLVDRRTSVSELFLTVHGSDALKVLSDRFREEGFSDVPSEWAGGPSTISWVRRMGFPASYAGQRSRSRPAEFIVPGAVRLNPLHTFQKRISEELRGVLTSTKAGRSQKCMIELPTGAGKTRVVTETVLRLFKDEVLSGTVLWIAQSIELCEQAVRTFESVWSSLQDERPLTIGRLWESNQVHEPETGLGVIVATDAKLDSVLDRPEYEWLSQVTAVFVDEAHRTGGSTRYTRLFRWLGVDGRSWDRPLVGLSATPFKGRADDHAGTRDLVARFGNKRIAAFEQDAYKYLVADGVLAHVRHEVLPGVEVDLDAGERRRLSSMRLIDSSVLEKIGRDEQRMKVLVEHILKQDPHWPILVFTPSVLSAQVLAATLRYRNVSAEAVSGQTGRHKRRDVIERFKKGEVRVLANCDLLVQGFDAPGVRALYIARPTFSPSAYIQMAGRGLRGPENGGKEECVIVDVADNWGAENDFLGYQEYQELWKEQRE